jgi:hypothetical protein
MISITLGQKFGVILLLILFSILAISSCVALMVRALIGALAALQAITPALAFGM